MLLDLYSLYFPMPPAPHVACAIASVLPDCGGTGMTYDVGQLVQFTATVTDLSGDPATPDENIFYVKAPDGTVNEYGADVIGDGVYGVDVLLSQPGIYYFRYEGSGTYIAVVDSSVNVATSPFYPC